MQYLSTYIRQKCLIQYYLHERYRKTNLINNITRIKLRSNIIEKSLNGII